MQRQGLLDFRSQTAKNEPREKLRCAGRLVCAGQGDHIRNRRTDDAEIVVRPLQIQIDRLTVSSGSRKNRWREVNDVDKLQLRADAGKADQWLLEIDHARLAGDHG